MWNEHYTLKANQCIIPPRRPRCKDVDLKLPEVGSRWGAYTVLSVKTGMIRLREMKTGKEFTRRLTPRGWAEPKEVPNRSALSDQIAMLADQKRRAKAYAEKVGTHEAWEKYRSLASAHV
ncbi:hypothetical protein DQW77_17465 [Roseovarius sp. TE539]|uniref:hypothetical protein n=1 Tax=Roseovarius sp. TE539 TaxID=2249812 RepID=UPI000DE045AA|nr:hypothetical protein [Roseovarius sp. TE539]RBI67550.1 hypothetical protein DQW77_17465 [Roseovarius sp. TE539]